MSIARAVTKRIKRPDAHKEPVPPLPTRSHTVKSPTNFDRTKISLPVALVSTTNMLSYNAPNIKSFKKGTPLSISSMQSSGEDSDNSVSGRSRASSHSSRHTTLTDASSVAESPISPKPNQLSGFFPPGKPIRKSASTTSLQKVKEEPAEPVPAIPQRATSHSKDAHEQLARKRSVRSVSTHVKSSSRGSISQSRNSREQRSSLDIIRGATEKAIHPFDRELKQLNEVVEEFSRVARNSEAESDLTVMRSMNLAAFCAADYLAEIRPLFSDRFGHKAARMAWI